VPAGDAKPPHRSNAVTTTPGPAGLAAAALRSDLGLDADAAGCSLHLPGSDPVLPSSFCLATAAQASIGAAALTAAEIGVQRGGPRQALTVDATAAALEGTGWFSVDGVAPDLWDPLSGLYRCGSGQVRIHANFAHHRDAALRLLGLPTGDATPRAEVQAALADWQAEDVETALIQAGGVGAALRSFAQWDAHPQALALAGVPLIRLTRTGDAPPRPWPALPAGARPLHGLRVLELTRIIAGPVAGRALAAWGADVLLLNAPQLPNIAALADTSRGKRSALLDLHQRADAAQLRALLQGAHVLLHGYRPGALDTLGLDPTALAEACPGLIDVRLSAWGGDPALGPWALRRGFDSLVQTATGFNRAEGEAAAFAAGRSAGADEARALPCQMIDCASGYLLALGALAALQRQQREGGSWRVEVALAITGRWLRGLGRVEGGFAAAAPAREPWLEISDTAWGRLAALRHPARFSATPAGFSRPSARPGDNAPRWA
jgi:hypothetical protein